MQALQYPFDSEALLRHRKKLRRQLLADGTSRLEKKIAVLGGSTTADICSMLELFLLDEGIAPVFYESEYAQYWQDAMFPNPKLEAFAPDVIVIHTTNRNLPALSQDLTLSSAVCDAAVEEAYQHFAVMWERLSAVYHCPIVQNNFELPSYRLLGNADASDVHGLTRSITRLNEKCYQYAEAHRDFYIHDLLSLSASYGLDQWADPAYWYLYKYAMAMPAIPVFAHSLSRILKAMFGRNRKVLALDLDNTLWGGVIGDDGQAGIEIGHENAVAEAYTAFQQYLKALQARGVLLTICSKNEPENALLGLRHPDSVLHPEDFVCIMANWNPKSENLQQMAETLQLLPESFVFVDDNPAERAIVRGQLPQTAVPEFTTPEQYIRVLDRNGYFEMTAFSADDATRTEMYRANAARAAQAKQFPDYAAYLRSLEMAAQIVDFTPVSLPRITQLTNKSNQFNLTTRRYTESEMQQVLESDTHVRLCGRLRDTFGDNGIVSVVIGEQQGEILTVQLWLMSCRVLKRDMEFAMLDALVDACKRRGIGRILGIYLPTAKNGMVRELYGSLGFTKTESDPDGRTVWELETAGYVPQNHVIRVEETR